MELLLGKPLAETLLSRLISEIKLMENQPGLAAVLVGSNAASKLYVDLKRQTAERIGVDFYEYRFPENVSQEDLMACINILNEDDAVDGILVQLPLPEGFDRKTILNSIRFDKDIDGLCDIDEQNSFGNKCLFHCPFPKSMMMLIQSSNVTMQGKTGVVLANSPGFGESMAGLMRGGGIQTNVVIRDDIDQERETIRNADFIVTALGNPGRVGGSLVRRGVVVIDGGIDKVDGRVRGDVDEASVRDKIAYLSPVPGGVGPLTIACLMENVVMSAKRHKK